MSSDFRIGTGFDVHAFGDGDHVVLAGVRIAHERGLVAQHDGQQWRLDAADVATVDTSGAGDVFCAALATVIAGGAPMREACAWANIAAAVSVTRPGTIPSFPSRADVEAAAAQSLGA